VFQKLCSIGKIVKQLVLLSMTLFGLVIFI